MAAQQIPVYTTVIPTDDANTASALVVRDGNGDTWQRIARGSQGLRSSGHVYVGTASKTTTYTLAETETVCLCDATGGAFTVTCPASSGVAGQLYTVVKTDASTYAVTVDGNASETIGGLASVVLAQRYDSVTFVSDGTNWQVLARFIRPADQIELMSLRDNTGLVLDATGGASKFAIALTPGTSLKLAGEAAQGNTKTDYLTFEYVVPTGFPFGITRNLTVTIAAEYDGTGTAGTKTLDVEAWLMSTAGACGADICATAAQTITDTAADYSFTITGTTLTAGCRLLVRVTAVMQETGSSNPLNAVVESIRMA